MIAPKMMKKLRWAFLQEKNYLGSFTITFFLLLTAENYFSHIQTEKIKKEHFVLQKYLLFAFSLTVHFGVLDSNRSTS